jgi:2-polyprenylphenol 6-hydroxylase
VHTCDVAIVGGSIVGASLALALADTHLSVVLIEPHPPSLPANDGSWDSRVYTFSPGNIEWLRQLDVWERMRLGRTARVETMAVFGDEHAGRLGFSAYDAGMRELAQVAENRELQAALWQKLADSPHVTVFASTRCRDIVWEREYARIFLEQGDELEARLVVGADGADSWVRERAGVGATVHDYGQTGVVANFAAERPHAATAFQWFRHDGVLALLPLAGDRVSMVWSARDGFAHELLAMSSRRLCDTVELASAAVVGRLELITGAAGFPLKRQRVDRLVEPRVVLIGDAAHNVHPLAGQGVNLGLRDARELATVLRERGPQLDCGDYALLRRYERARKEDILALEAITDGLEKLFAAPAVWMARLRNLGLTLVDLQPPLKTALVRRAAV